MKLETENRRSVVGVLILQLSFWAWGVHAQTNFSIDWFTIDGGGGMSTGGVYSVSGTIGQPDAGSTMSGGSFTLDGGFWSLIAAVQSPGAPTLWLTRSENSVILSWLATATSFLLENNSNLSVTNGWSAVIPAPVSINGFNYVTNTIAPGNNFYRLRLP